MTSRLLPARPFLLALAAADALGAGACREEGLCPESFTLPEAALAPGAALVMPGGPGPEVRLALQ